MNNKYSPQDRIKEKSEFGKWFVSLNGDMIFDNGRYAIYSNQLDKNNWIAHFFEKSWIDWNEFMPAYFQALKNAGIKEKTILIFY